MSEICHTCPIPPHCTNMQQLRLVGRKIHANYSQYTRYAFRNPVKWNGRTNRAIPSMSAGPDEKPFVYNLCIYNWQKKHRRGCALFFYWSSKIMWVRYCTNKMREAITYIYIYICVCAKYSHIAHDNVMMCIYAKHFIKRDYVMSWQIGIIYNTWLRLGKVTHYWHFVRGIHQSPVGSLHKWFSNAEL